MHGDIFRSQCRNDFIAIRQILLPTSQVKFRNVLMSSGAIDVVLNGCKTSSGGV